MIHSFRNIVSVGCIMVICCAAGAQQGSVWGNTAVTAISGIDRAQVKKTLVIQGVITSYKPPVNDRAPHSFLLKDNTGVIRVAVWSDAWNAIPFKDQLQNNASVMAKVEIAEFRGNLEGHLNHAEDIKMAGAPALAAAAPGGDVRVLSADPIPWVRDIKEGLKLAAASKKQILVFFENPSVENSRFIDTTVFTDIKVRAAVQEKFIPVKINVAQNYDLAKSLGVFRAGIVVIYDASGNAVKQLATLKTPQDLLREIN
ncbi:MAG: thioredoxin family protein [Candidatus Sumerlaeaceae bacterium]|nr:thioredoxin family protein [Candidatus Sumerlaeaceae bacterium]